MRSRKTGFQITLFSYASERGTLGAERPRRRRIAHEEIFYDPTIAEFSFSHTDCGDVL